MSDEKPDDDKTEEPTQRKLEEAIKKGDVAKSIELNTFFILGGFTLAILIAGGHAVRETALSMRSFLMNAHQVPSSGMTVGDSLPGSSFLICSTSRTVPAV